jgi:hypothetical protein
MSDDNVRELPNLERDQMAGDFAQLARALRQMTEQRTAIAEAKRSMFLAYIEAGFSEQQALELSKSLV